MTGRQVGRRAFSNVALATTFVLSSAVIATAEFVPAQYTAGTLPPIPVGAVAAGEVFLDVHVDAAGRVAEVNVLRATPPFTDAVVAAVRDWRFLPAEDDLAGTSAAPADARRRIPVDSHVLVAAVYRPPTLNGPTLGESARDIAPPPETMPAALATAMPVYPADALADGVVLAEARVGADGRVERASVLRPAPPFNQTSLDALRAWMFRPPRVGGRAVTARVYVIFAFRQPVT